MGMFFDGWRRKSGCVALVMACLVMCMWIRSLAIEDVLEFSISGRPQALVACHGRVQWFWFIDFAKHSIEPPPLNLTPAWLITVNPQFPALETPESSLEAKYYGEYDSDDGREMERMTVPYWSLAVPLTVLSACLILLKPKHRDQPS